MKQKVHNIGIRNYRSCVNTKLELQTNLTALIGINGSGKSNILNAIQLLKRVGINWGLHHKSLDDSTRFSTTIELSLTLSNSVAYDVKLDIYHEPDDNNTERISDTEIKYKKTIDKQWRHIEGDAFVMMSRYSHMLDVDHFRDVLFKSDIISKLDEEQKNIAKELIRLFQSISYYGATQFSDPTNCPVSFELEDVKSTQQDKRSRYRAHGRFLHDLYVLSQNDKKAYKRYINIVDKTGIGLVDKIKFYEQKMPTSNIEVKSGAKIKKIEREKTIVIPSVEIDGITLLPNQLSEGTFKTLALIFYIINDSCEFLLIEEPEVCVHHGLLGSIIELIIHESQNKQIIISTHSDYVLDKLKPENVLVVQRNSQNGTTAKTLTQAMGKSDFEALKEYLNESGNLGEYWKEGGFDNE